MSIKKYNQTKNKSKKIFRNKYKQSKKNNKKIRKSKKNRKSLKINKYKNIKNIKNINMIGGLLNCPTSDSVIAVPQQTYNLSTLKQCLETGSAGSDASAYKNLFTKLGI